MWLSDVMMLGKVVIFYGDADVVHRIGRDMQRLWRKEKDKVGRLVISGLRLPCRGVLPRGFCSPTHGPTAPAPTKRHPNMGEGRGRREHYPTAGSAQRGNPCSTEVSHSSPSGG